jgi:hypothetical protein
MVRSQGKQRERRGHTEPLLPSSPSLPQGRTARGGEGGKEWRGNRLRDLTAPPPRSSLLHHSSPTSTSGPSAELPAPPPPRCQRGRAVAAALLEGGRELRQEVDRQGPVDSFLFFFPFPLAAILLAKLEFFFKV